MVIHEAAENYLEAILILGQEQSEVRSVDICNFFGFAKSTVSVAMKKLREKGLILMDESGYIHLTESGQKIAQKIYERHIIIAELFMQLGVSKEKALEDACKVEHDLSEETFAALKKYCIEHRES